MSVIVTIWFTADPEKFEQMTKENEEQIAEVSRQAQEAGVMAHRFYGSEGQVMVIDEWPDAESFQRFFAEAEPDVAPMMQAVATGEPEITFWTKLETGDDVGWDDSRGGS